MMMCCSLRLFLPEVILFVNVRVRAITVTIYIYIYGVSQENSQPVSTKGIKF